MKTLLSFILTVVLIKDISGLDCYSCSSSSSDFGYAYDVDCGSANYDGFVHSCEKCNICYIYIYADGHVKRGTGTGMANVCSPTADYLYCSCKGNLCNQDLCYQCQPTSISTEISTTAETTTSLSTTTTPRPGIFCYDCQNANQNLDNYDEACSQTDFDWDTTFCQNCRSCFTEIHDDGRVFRGEAGDFQDGVCVSGEDDSGSYAACYCTQNLCNSDLCEYCPKN